MKKLISKNTDPAKEPFNIPNQSTDPLYEGAANFILNIGLQFMSIRTIQHHFMIG